MPQPKSSVAILAAFVCTICLTWSVSHAERPEIQQILPDTTVAYLHVLDAPDLVQQVGSTAIGRMLQDEQVKPFVTQLYDSAADAFAAVGDDVGLSFDDILEIPQGEACIAVVARDQQQPAFLVLVEAGDQIEAGRKFVDFIQGRMLERGDLQNTETANGTELTVLQRSEESNAHVVFFERDDTIGFSTDLEVAKQVLNAWAGIKTSSLADTPEFDTISDQWSASNEDPQLVYFVNPIQLFKSVTAGNMMLQVGLSVLRPLGLDGLQGVGGSLILGGDRYESVYHVVVALDSPQTGVLEVLALQPGDVTPEVWAPADVAAYMTMHWDFQESYTALVEVYDFFQQDGAWARDLETPAGQALGVDLKDDVLAGLDGRITRIGWLNEEDRRQSTLLGLKLKDPKAFRGVLHKIAQRSPGMFVDLEISGVDCYDFSPRRGAATGLLSRLPDSKLAILGDYLLLTDNVDLLEHVIKTKSGATPPLSQELDFRLVASAAKRRAGDAGASMLWFTRPEVGIRTTYELLRSEDAKKAIASLAQSNAMFAALDQALKDNPLPPFNVLEKYFAVSGGVATKDKDGFHFVGFTYKRK